MNRNVLFAYHSTASDREITRRRSVNYSGSDLTGKYRRVVPVGATPKQGC